MMTLSPSDRLAITSKAIVEFFDGDNEFATEMRWDKQLLLEFLEKVSRPELPLCEWEQRLVRILGFDV